MPIYREATKNMLTEFDNVFSMFASFLGAELKTKTAVTPQKVHDGSLLASTNIMPEQSENCNTQTQEILEPNRHLSRNTELVQKEI